MKQGLLKELKRRHVYRVAVAYAVVGWLLIQLAATVFPAFGAPDWVLRVMIAAIVIGFPVSLIMAWAFEVTPEGVRRTEPADSAEARAPEHDRKVGRTLDYMIICVLALALALSVWRPWAARRPDRGMTAATATASTTVPAPEASAHPALRASLAIAPSSIPPKSIAVLPFENLSENKTNGYFADGMQDLILTKLADIGQLKVISRTSTMHYGSHPDNLRQIGQELGVATLLEGSVQRSGNQVLINVQLIDARSDSHIWANSYQRTLKNVFGVEGEVAGKIADALKAKLSPAETQHLASGLSDNLEANDLYLRGSYHFRRAFTNAYFFRAIRQAIPFYRKAIELAPDFALAHADLSYAETLIVFNNPYATDFDVLGKDAGQHARLAVKLAPELPEAYLAMGWYDNVIKGDRAGASQAFAKALSLRPNYPIAMAGQSFVLLREGEFDKALAAIQRAYVLDPRSTPVIGTLGQVYQALNRFSEAEKAYKQANALSPDTTYHDDYANSILFATGDTQRAMDAYKQSDSGFSLPKAWLLAYQRKYDAAIALIQNDADFQVNASSRSHVPEFLMLADLNRLAGNTKRAKTYYARVIPLLHAQLPVVADNMLSTAEIWSAIADAQLGMGNTSAGMAAIKASLRAGERAHNRWRGLGIQVSAALNYAQAGRANRATVTISHALSTTGIGYTYAPVMLWLDPRWDPIRDTPAFRALLRKYAKDKPPGALGKKPL